LQWSTLEWMRDVAIVLAVVESRVLLIRRRSRIDRKQDLETEEIWSDMVSDESNMTPRLRAESDGLIVTLESMWRVASETLESCLGRPISKNSVLDWLSERRLVDIQVETESMVVSRWETFCEKYGAEKEMKSWVSSA